MPAVAVIRKRLALFLLNRFKGYSNGKAKSIRNFNAKLEFYIRGQYLRRRDEMFLYQRDSVKAKAALYVITDVE